MVEQWQQRKHEAEDRCPCRRELLGTWIQIVAECEVLEGANPRATSSLTFSNAYIYIYIYLYMYIMHNYTYVYMYVYMCIYK